MLILFDVDGTMLTSERVGLLAITDAGRAMFGETFTLEGVSVAGRLDTLIWADAIAANELDVEPGHAEEFRGLYREKLEARLAAGVSVTALPGVFELLEALRSSPEVTLGLVTGNFPETGRLKIEAAGIDADQFEVAAWGCDGPNRRALPPVAIGQYHQRFDTSLSPERVVIIGDTPHDIDCAQVNGCRSIGVGTGHTGRAELEACGADLALDDLSATGEIMEWIMSHMESQTAIRE